jgi:hypothetical protein
MAAKNEKFKKFALFALFLRFGQETETPTHGTRSHAHTFLFKNLFVFCEVILYTQRTQKHAEQKREREREREV